MFGVQFWKMGPELRVKLAAAGALVLLIGAAIGIQLVLATLLGAAGDTPGWLLAGAVVSAAVLTAVAGRWRPRWMTVLGFSLAFLGLGPALTAASMNRPSRSREWNVRHNRATAKTGHACIAVGAALVVVDRYRRHREKAASLSKRGR